MTDTKPTLPNRLASIDAYRGLVLALMMGEALHFCLVSAARPIAEPAAIRSGRGLRVRRKWNNP